MGVFLVFLERKGKAFPSTDTSHFDFFPKHFDLWKRDCFHLAERKPEKPFFPIAIEAKDTFHSSGVMLPELAWLLPCLHPEF